MIKKDKIQEFLIKNSIYAGMPNKGYKVNDIELDKEMIFENGIFAPLVVMYANALSNILFKKDIFKFKIIKDLETLCFLTIEDEEDEEEEGDEGEELFFNSIASLLVMDAIKEIFILKYKNGLDLIDIVTLSRESVAHLKKGERINSFSIYKNIKSKEAFQIEGDEKLKIKKR